MIFVRKAKGEMERILSEGGAIDREFRILLGDGRVRCISYRRTDNCYAGVN